MIVSVCQWQLQTPHTTWHNSSSPQCSTVIDLYLEFNFLSHLWKWCSKAWIDNSNISYLSRAHTQTTKYSDNHKVIKIWVSLLLFTPLQSFLKYNDFLNTIVLECFNYTLKQSFIMLACCHIGFSRNCFLYPRTCHL